MITNFCSAKSFCIPSLLAVIAVYHCGMCLPCVYIHSFLMGPEAPEVFHSDLLEIASNKCIQFFRSVKDKVNYLTGVSLLLSDALARLVYPLLCQL